MQHTLQNTQHYPTSLQFERFGFISVNFHEGVHVPLVVKDLYALYVSTQSAVILSPILESLYKELS